MVKPTPLHCAALILCLLCGAPRLTVAQEPDAVPQERSTARALIRFLLEAQHPETGLLESFPQSPDTRLAHVAFTYDMALTAIVLAHAGELDAARRTMALYRTMALPRPGTCAFNTAYHVEWRRPVLEYRLHGGPLYWVALALIRCGSQGGAQADADVEKGLGLLEWVKEAMPHIAGGVAMGIEEPWDSLMSVENNWVYYAALRIASQSAPAGLRRDALIRERARVRHWLMRHERNRGDGDDVKALDVYTHALLVGPEAHLEDTAQGEGSLSVWAKNWVDELEALFRVPGTSRYDYTDGHEAKLIGRNRAGWLEGTEQVVVAYVTWIPFFERLGDRAFADTLRQRAHRAHNEVLQWGLPCRGALAVPNTDAPRPFQTFMEGWMTRPRSEPALNGTTWAYLAEVGYNPLTTALPARPREGQPESSRR